MPGKVKRYIAKNNIQFYTCDAVSAAKEIGLGARRTNSILQAAFFKLANIIPIDKAEEYMKERYWAVKLMASMATDCLGGGQI